jgi:hypothetical protein
MLTYTEEDQQATALTHPEFSFLVVQVVAESQARAMSLTKPLLLAEN